MKCKHTIRTGLAFLMVLLVSESAWAQRSKNASIYKEVDTQDLLDTPQDY